MLYQNFYPKWNFWFQTQLAESCATEFELYKNLSTSDSRYNAACIDTALCLMENTDKNIDSQTASTGVLLGLLPSILSLLGSSPVELALLSTSRPLLGFLLALAAPVVNPMRLFEYVDPNTTLKSLSHVHRFKDQRTRTSRLVAVLQVVLATGAMANITLVAFDLYSKAYSVVTACRYRSHIFLWIYLAGALWLGGILSLLSCARFERSDNKTTHRPGWPSRLYKIVEEWLHNELTLCSQHEKRSFSRSAENKCFLFFSQALSLGTVAHIIYGTAIFSGYQFIQPMDAFVIVVRFVVSAWISRLILRFELAGMAAKTERARAEDDERYEGLQS